MSETTPRRYYGRLNTSPRRRRVSKLRLLFRLFLFAVLAALVGGGYWISRDTCPVARLIPIEHKYVAEFTEPLEARNRVGASPLWPALAGVPAMERVPELMDKDLGIPYWVLNNLFPESIYATGNNIETFEDAVLLTKASRIGALVEWVHLLMPGIERESAGGLQVRKLVDADLFYAMRGRVLALSASRDALVEALTLDEGAAMTESQLEDSLALRGREDMNGSLSLSPEDPLGAFFESIRFALRVDAEGAYLVATAKPAPDLAARLAPLLEGVTPQTLLAPPEGMVALSANFCKPMKDVWNGLGAASELDFFSAEWWSKDDGGADDAGPGLPVLAGHMLGELGPGIRISLDGVDQFEIFPMPEFVATVDAEPEVASAVFTAIPAVPPDTLPWAPVLRRADEADRAYLPLFAGPALEPTAAPYGDGVLISSSKTVADRLLASPPQHETLPQEGNLYLRIQPSPCVEALVAAARQLVEQDLLRGYTPDSFEEYSGQWLQRASLVDAVVLHAEVERERIAAAIRVVCPAPG
jgi:hypothetical protein